MPSNTKKNSTKQQRNIFAAEKISPSSTAMAQQDFRSTPHSTESGTALALLLFFMILPLFSFVLHPLLSAYSRKHEFEADAYAATQTAATDMVSALVKLYQDNAATLTPDPLYSSFYDSHPPAATRIAHLQALRLQAPRLQTH